MDNELIKIISKDGKQLVSARELHEFLEVKSKYADWIKNRIKKYEFIENEDYLLVTKTLETNNPKNPFTEVTEHIISLDMAKELSMVENNDKGKQARKYFIECEKKLKESNSQLYSYQIDDPIERAKQWIKEQEEKQKAINERNRLIHINKTYSSSEIAKELGLRSATQLNKLLSDKHIQYKSSGTWLLYSEYAERNFVSIKEQILENDKIVYNRRWTGLGRDFILSLF